MSNEALMPIAEQLVPLAESATEALVGTAGAGALAVSVEGGDELRRIVEDAITTSEVTSIEVGFFRTAKYSDGTPVAAVAAWNEFGTRRIPERPFFRQALIAAESDVRNLIKQEIDPKKLVMTEELANRVAALVAAHVQNRIVNLREPPNAPSTIEKKGSTNPLVDTGKMRQSVTWLVRK